MKALLGILTLVSSLGALAQVDPTDLEYSQTGSPERYGRDLPDYPVSCSPSQREVLLPRTRDLALAKLATLAVERSVQCTLKSSGIELALGECKDPTRVLYVAMWFKPRCARGTTTLRKTRIRTERLP